MLQGWEKEHPGRTETIFTAIKNISPSQLADVTRFDFSSLTIERPQSLLKRISAVNIVGG